MATTMWSIVLAFFLSAICYTIFKGIHNAVLHPLRSFPGPKLWSTTYLFRHVSNMRGQLDWSLKAFHEKYGPVVRFSPDELSFMSEQAWKDIHEHRNVLLIKDPLFYDSVKSSFNTASDIHTADARSHQQIRKQLAHAFSEKALRDQEPFMKSYVDLLMEKLRGVAAAGKPADMVQWLNFTTFDLIGELAVGKSFGCLNNSQYHDWVSEIFNSIKVGPYIRAMATYTAVPRLMRFLAPTNIKEASSRHQEYVQENVQERLQKGVMEERKDFISYILKNRAAKNGLTDKEIAANCGLLIKAGSETTATALSGVIYHLLKNPAALQKVTSEVRNAFATEAEINFVNVSGRVPYMLACLAEGLRTYSPVPTILPRRTPIGCMTEIDGYRVPGWTNVGVHQLSASASAVNFHRPDAFVPERWLPESTTEPTSPFYRDRRGASQPFSLGQRNCLGKSLAHNEMRVILARLLWNFDLELCAESEEWHQQRSYTVWEKPPLMCRLHDCRSPLPER